MKFTDFAVEQVDRLGAIAEFAQKISVAGQKEIVTWLIVASGETDRRDRSGTAEWVRNSDGARRIKRLIDECVEFTSPPGLADIKTVWLRLYPLAGSHARCEACGGTGWRIVERNGVEGAARCGADSAVSHG